MAKNLPYLVKSRGYIRGQLTKLSNKIDESLISMSHEERCNIKSKLERLSSEIATLDKQISAITYDTAVNKDEALDKELADIEVYTDLITKCTNQIALSMFPVAVSGELNVANKLKLPELPLPEYSHNSGESLTNFLTAFESILLKHNLTEYEKFVYLKKQLKKEPLLLISSLEPANQSYTSAKALLKSAFSNTISQQYEAINKLSQLHLKTNGNVYEYVSSMRIVKEMFKELKIDINCVMQYFFWTGMPVELQNHLINICNNNKPTLAEIDSNIFKAIERFNEVRERTKTNFNLKNKSDNECKVEGFAVNVNYDKSSTAKARVFCSLCSGKDTKVTDHSTRDCSVYKTPESKLTQLEKLGACTRCGYLNHATKECKFRFSKSCSFCNKFHMSFLCKKSNQIVTGDPKLKVHERKHANEKVSSGVIWTETIYHVNKGSYSILPTFSASLGGQKIRCLKDSGCQPNFIKHSLAKTLNLPVLVSQFEISINGFNETKKYIADLVQVDLQINDHKCSIKAICVPDISITLNIPNLPRVVDGFIAKGYKIADEFLLSRSNVISNIQLVMGMNDSYVLPEKQTTFGEHIPSVFSETKAGIMLMGNVEHIIDNITALPENLVNFHCTSDSVELRDICCQMPGGNVANSLMVNCTIEHVNEVMTNNGEVDHEMLNVAAEDILNQELSNYLNYDSYTDENYTEINSKLVNYVISNSTRRSDGRLQFPLTWRSEISHLLGQNLNLCEVVLRSNFTKLNKNFDRLKMVDAVFKEQEQAGVIQKIPDIDSFVKNNPKCSFLAHMPVFKMDHQSTKCRVVFLSNVVGKDEFGNKALSHNQVIYPGPNLNSKITSAVLNLRFGQTLLIYDLRKAFLQIALRDEDSNRLLFLWYNDILNNDYTLIAYKNLRLSFGLRCSPTILMLAMYKILCLDTESDSTALKEFKKHLYSNMYVDNGGYSGTQEEVLWAYENLPNVFNPYQFDVQQLVTNDSTLQTKIDEKQGSITPDCVKLLGLQWDRNTDELFTQPINLDKNANSKRLILKTIASQYDIFNIQGPCLNRARLFLHSLQCDKTLEWDTVLSDKLLKEWNLIVRQANRSDPIKIDRHIGDRTDPYSLIAFGDASRSIIGAVVYMKNLRTQQVCFIMAKNKMINKQMENRSIPALELQAIHLATEMLSDTYEELCGLKVVRPVLIKEMHVFTDSMINIHWLNSYNYKMEKMEKHSIFVLNRLNSIVKLCNKLPISFHYVSTDINPADCISRAVSHGQLLKSSYVKGPEFLKTFEMKEREFTITIPNPIARSNEENFSVCKAVPTEAKEHLIPLERYGEFKKIVKILSKVLIFVNNMKIKLIAKDKTKYAHLKVYPTTENFFNLACNKLIKRDQEINFPAEYNYLINCKNSKRDIPNLISKFNLFVSSEGILKIKSKFERWEDNKNFCFPILLSKDSILTRLIIKDSHIKFSHCGVYQLLTHLRKNFWVINFFSTVRKILKDCIICKRMNSRPVKLNQNSYRSFRADPPTVPYKNIFLDHLGPFYVLVNDRKVKIWLLCITCLYTRSVNIIICPDMTVKSFIRAFQMHIFQEGLPEKVLSDAGSQLVAGSKLISSLMADEEVSIFLHENGIKDFNMEQYPKGQSALGSLVEICVKFTKRLIYGAIRNSVLKYHDFELIVVQTISLLNKRPIAFKNSLRDSTNVSVPAPITPELLTRGRDLITPNVIPAVNTEENEDPNWLPDVSMDKIRKEFDKVSKSRNHLIKVYNEEFKNNLMTQAMDKNLRYKKVLHNKVEPGDIILLKEDLTKFNNFPLARVHATVVNSLGEVTAVKALKGCSRELVERHINTVIPLLKDEFNKLDEKEQDTRGSTKRRSKRIAAKKMKK